MTEEAPPLGNPEFEAPERPTPEQMEAVKERLRLGVDSALTDPLANLDDEHRGWLRAFAFHEPDDVPVLEREIRGLMEDRQAPPAARRAFNLREFIRWATRRARQIRDEQDRRQRTARAHLRLVSGGRSDAPPERGTREIQRDHAALTVVQMIESESPHLIAAGHILQRRQGRIWRESFYGDNFTDWAGDDDARGVPAYRIDDRFITRLYTWLLMLDSKLWKQSDAFVAKAINYVAEMDSRNAPRDWLRSLRWDGVARLDTMLPVAFKTGDTAYIRAVSKSFVISMVARVMRPGCKVDTMPVFIGPQGSYKSTGLLALGGEFARTVNVPAHNKDFEDALRGLMMGEIAEMDAIASTRVDINRVKTLLSTPVDRFRPSYGRTTMDFPRTVVLVGTTNKEYWHRDETGGRRFWPVRVTGRVDVEWIKQNREQIFAEAVRRYDDGESWWDIPQEEQEAAVAEHFVEEPWVAILRPILASWTRPGRGRCWDGWNDAERLSGNLMAASDEEKWGTVITTLRLLSQAIGMPRERQRRPDAIKIAEVMRGLGWSLKQWRPPQSGIAERVYIWRRDNPVPQSEIVLEMRQSHAGDEDIPF